jgi:hypothetical protein
VFTSRLGNGGDGLQMKRRAGIRQEWSSSFGVGRGTTNPLWNKNLLRNAKLNDLLHLVPELRSKICRENLILVHIILYNT